jgi:hypothetical protein
VEDRRGSREDEASFQEEVVYLQRILGVAAGCAQTAEEEEAIVARFAVGMVECEGMTGDLDSMDQTVVPSC